MANQAAKKLKAQNEKEIRNLFNISLGVFLLYVVVRFCFYSGSLFHYVLFSITSAALYFCYSSLRNFAKPTITAGEETYNDIKQGGLCEYYYDVIYISWFVLVTSLISDWFWLIYLSIPAFAGWKLWGMVIKPYLDSRSQEQVPEDDKKKKKTERQKFRTMRR